MRIATFRRLDDADERADRIGVLLDAGMIDVSAFAQSDAAAHRRFPPGLPRLLAGGEATLQQVRAFVTGAQAGTPIPLHCLRLLAPIPRPGKIVAVGRNYADHAKETGIAAPESPRLISKVPSSVVGHGACVAIPRGVRKLDFEVELAVVIGRVAKDVAEADALRYVAGYTVLNDLSAREFQFDVSPPQSTFSKSMDGFCPMGPWIVTADEIPDPQDLRLRLWLNDAVMQDGQTRDMIHSVAEVVAYASQYLTLEPGDILATGTPAGVGLARNPPVWLRPGDRLRLEIERVGTLEHSIA